MKTKPTQPTSDWIGRLRVANQRILGSSFKSPQEAVRFMLAMQGQDFPGVKWSIGLRVAGSTLAQVEAAFNKGQIVRSWPMRGTLHVTAAEDLPWMLDLHGKRIIDGMAGRRAQLGLDDKSHGRAQDLAIRGLNGGKALGRAEIFSLFEKGGVSTKGQRGYHLLAHLSISGVLCLGPLKGKEQAFVLLEEWIKKPRRLDRDEALGELTRRYFTSHGPATLGDLSGWAKLTVKDTKTGFALAKKSLVELKVDSKTYYMAPDSEAVLAKAWKGQKTHVAALPGFDEYLLGYKDREAVLEKKHFEKVVPGSNGMFMSTIVIDGKVVGTWHRKAGSKATVIETRPFRKLSKSDLQGFATAVSAWGKFVGTPTRPA